MTATAITESPAEPPLPDAGAPAAGRSELGSITISESVVAKLAAQAALEIPDAGAAAPRLLGRSLSGAGGLGVRPTSLSALPKASAHVDASIALIRLEISVRWPASVPAVSTAVREHVRARLAELTGLNVAEVTIRVTDLVTETAQPARRVR
ncbi:MAG TPA: Asp23/Gls24 family envelope stress response protein [Jatrophihabitans sp.]|jgi:uncharacterized alkaline shock family protein YloU|nr:Asp23/Gls24 family envelope stress response protein [Jatrophihabitans sp.]